MSQRLIVCGAGVIGSNLAKYLAEERHEVTLIEQKQNVAARATEKLDVQVTVGSAFDPKVLEEAGVGQADMVIAVTNSDVANLTICSLAAAFGAKKMIARVRDIALSGMVERHGRGHFHVDEIINPDEVAAQTIVKIMEAPGSSEVADFAGGRILLRSFNVLDESPLVGERLGDLRDSEFPWPFVMVGINRDGKIHIPRGDDVVETRDRIYVLLPKPSLAEFLTFVHPGVRLPKKVIIYGATNTGTSLAKSLSEKVPDVVLLEENRLKAEKVAGELKDVRVIHGLASEADILRECGVEAADAYIAVSASDHHNLISAVLAKQMGAKTTVITTHTPDYIPIVAGLGIDAFINPRLLATDQIMRLVRGERISHVASLPEVKAEVLELVAEPDSPITRKPLKDFKFPKNSIVGAICREDEVVLASGDSHVRAGEPVVVFCHEDAVPQIEKLFTKRKLL
ncbi:MAG: Trk system potassium transporter TrkA [bacterium]|nr:Trk system potassium transporter TrkA [bacterium]MDT8365884.1 Trk system potassium transporter TrkA [bacterium]